MRLVNTFSLLVCSVGLMVPNQSLVAQLPSGIVLSDIPGGTFVMGSNSLMGAPTQQVAAPEHQVNLTPYAMSEAEITNAQYVEFLNAAYNDGLIEVVVGTMGPDNGKQVVQGTSSSDFDGKVFYSLEGIRVLKDHDDSDGDGNEFTGDVEPENPLNIAYIGFDATTELFYVKDPFDLNDFNWYEVCNYQDYGTTPMMPTGAVLNDFDDWSGAGLNYSDELAGWTVSDPSAAVNLPSQSEVANWPVTYIRWYGAKAFANYYGLSLPTEAQWEFAAKGGQDFQYAVHDGVDFNDANWNTAGMGQLALGHVRSAISGSANPFGLYNLAGNAWEWIEDNYTEPYDTAFVTDPLVLDPGSTLRCWRGGSWNYHQATLQSAIRFYDEENRGNDHFGFRVVGEHSSLGVTENDNEKRMIVYPSPCYDELHISFSVSGEVQVVILNASGVEVYTGMHNSNSVLNVTDLSAGVYFVSAEGQVQRIIKQ